MKLTAITAALLSVLLVACGDGKSITTADAGHSAGAQSAYPGDQKKSADGLRNTDFSKRTSTCGLYAKQVEGKSGLSPKELETKWGDLVTRFNKHQAEVNKQYGGDHQQYNTFERNRLSMEIDVLDCEIDKI